MVSRIFAAVVLSAVAMAGCDNTVKAVDGADKPTQPAVPATPPPPQIVKTPLDLSTAVAWGVAKVKTVDGAAEYGTAPGYGAFSGEIALPESVRKPGPGTVRLVVSAPIGGVVINATKLGDSNSPLSDRAVVLQADGEKTVELAVADMSQPTAILIANGFDKGASTVVIKSAEVEQKQ